MDSGYYAAVSGWVGRAQALDAAAANLANAQTAGYREERVYFRSYLPTGDDQDSQVGRAVNAFGLLGGSRLSFAQGAMQRTGSALDFAIEGEGFFAIQTANGVRFTRDGNFHRSQTGALVTEKGEPVLSEVQQAIPVPPGEVAVGEDGSLSVSGAVFGKLGVFAFAEGTQLRAEGANRYVAPQGAAVSGRGNYTVHQGELESANEDAIQGSLDLLMMQRQAEMMQKALMVFHSDFNKTASEELPRV